MNITQRDRNVLLAGFIFVVCYLLFFFVAEPIYKKQAKADGQIKNKIQFIQKYYEILNQKSYYQEKEKDQEHVGRLAVKKAPPGNPETGYPSSPSPCAERWPSG